MIIAGCIDEVLDQGRIGFLQGQRRDIHGASFVHYYIEPFIKAWSYIFCAWLISLGWRDLSRWFIAAFAVLLFSADFRGKIMPTDINRATFISQIVGLAASLGVWYSVDWIRRKNNRGKLPTAAVREKL